MTPNEQELWLRLKNAIGVVMDGVTDGMESKVETLKGVVAVVIKRARRETSGQRLR